ncbi:MAG: hypothetical protein ABFC77_06985 [Thermoguttaceae bacterium]
MQRRALAMLTPKQEALERMVQTEQIDDLPAAMMACSYALMEMNLRQAMDTGEIPDPIQVLRDLFDAGGLDDHFYDVREREGEGWEGRKMLKWGKATKQAHELMK